MDTTDIAGTSITSINVQPAQFYNQYTDTAAGGWTTSFQTQTPMTFCTNFFRLWRGSVKFTVKIVKTQFHSGRLLVCFNPNDTATTLTLNNSAFIHREIVDIRDCSEFSFTCPYALTRPYMAVNDSLGTLSVIVLNKLTAPDSVSTVINLIFEVAAGPDVELAVPISPMTGESSGLGWTHYPQYVPYVPKPPSVGVSMLAEMNDCDLTPPDFVPGGGSVKSAQLETSTLCIGEKITNFRQLLRRTSWMFALQGLTNVTWAQIRPWRLISLQYKNNSDGTNGPASALNSERPSILGDMLSTIGLCYAYNRGLS